MVVGTDQALDTNAGIIDAAIPEPARTATQAKLKAYILKAVAAKRHEVI